MLLPACGHVALHALLEQRPVEGLGAPAQDLRLEADRPGLEALDGGNQIVHGLPLEEEAGGGLAAPRGHDRLEDTSLPERDDGAPGRHGLERRDAEVLESGKDQRAAASIEL